MPLSLLQFYKKEVAAKEILNGTVERPAEAAGLYETLSPVSMAKALAEAADNDDVKAVLNMLSGDKANGK